MAGSAIWNNDQLKKLRYIFESKERSLYAIQYWTKLTKIGLPCNEDIFWNHTAINNFLSGSFNEIKNQALNISIVNQLKLPIVDAICLVFVDGFWNKSFSSQNIYPFVIKQSNEDQQYQLPTPINPTFFLYLNESLAEEITTIYLPKNSISTRPLYLLHISSGGQKPYINMANYRHHFYLESDSKTEIIEHYVSLSDNIHSTGSRTTFFISNNVQLKYSNMVCENNDSYHFSNNEMLIKNNAIIQIINLFLGSNIVVHSDNVKLNGMNSNFKINSLMLPINHALYKNNSYVEHNTTHCLSNQIHKNIIMNKGCSIFDGIIKVSRNAIKTDGNMINKNLLLSPLAEAHSKPHLEINTDDVQCRHSATVGHISEEQIFYLRSRGIAKNYAKNMIINAFTTEITSNITNIKCRNTIQSSIIKRIEGAEI